MLVSLGLAYVMIAAILSAYI